LSARVERIVRRVPQYFADRERELDNVATRVRLLDPRNVLARGWSITRTETGRVVRSASDVASGDVIVTVVSDGTFVSTIGEVRSESGSKSSSGDEPTHRDRES
jgi:exodeoxyribonuclease VII large subunit